MPENPKPRTTRQKTTANQPPQKFCCIHDKVLDIYVDNIRKNVCVNDRPLVEFKGKSYCLFHLPTDKKDGNRLLQILRERLWATSEQFERLESLSDDKKEELRKYIKYDFRFVWFNSFLNLQDFEFLGGVRFDYATFSGIRNNFTRTVFKDEAVFDNTTFLTYADFWRTEFNEYTSFENAVFNENTMFSYATFKKQANFEKTKFSKSATFLYTEFMDDFDFSNSMIRGECHFDSTTFYKKANFSKVRFSKYEITSFKKSMFSSETYFDRVRFNNDVNFNSAKFAKDSSSFFRGTFFYKNVDLQYSSGEGYLRFINIRQGKESKFDLQEAAFEKASRVSFHTMKLEPNWFVNVDPRKFVFTDIDWGKTIGWRGERSFWEKLIFPAECVVSGFRQLFWKDDDTLSPNIKGELEKLKARGITDQSKRLLEIACRQLSVNAEENNRYGEASQFRYMAMETKRLENEGIWRFLNLHWFYKWTSGYGESWRRAFVVLLSLLLAFSIVYSLPFAAFDHGEKKKDSVSDAVERQILDVADTGERFKSLCLGESVYYSLAVSALQKPEPKPVGAFTKFLVILQTILAPLQAALLALAIRRKFMR